MSQTTTLILLPETAYVDPGGGAPYTVTGDTTPAAAYYLGNRDLQTMNYSVASCTGDLLIQATLTTDPTDEDWFTIFEYNPVDATENAYSNFEGNFVYIRAVLSNFTAGTLNFVKLSY